MSETTEELLAQISQLRAQNASLKQAASRSNSVIGYEPVPEEGDAQLLSNKKIPYLSLNKDFSVSKMFDETRHSIIEGDNLGALVALAASNTKYDAIYIDPPYDTGKKWKYHDQWETPAFLTMIESRLQLAKEVLADDGIILLSIDDNRFAEIRLLMDKVFGRAATLGIFIWEKRTRATNSGGAATSVQSRTEYVLAYGGKDAKKYKFNVEKDSREIEYPFSDDNGAYRVVSVTQRLSIGDRKRDSMVYPILGIMPKQGNRWDEGKDKMQRLESEGLVFLKDNKSPQYKIYKANDTLELTIPLWNYLPADVVGSALTGRNELDRLIGGKHGFTTVKPVELIKKLLWHALADKPYANVLDFFAGSGTTLHAVAELNNDFGGQRRCVLITNNDDVEKEDDEDEIGIARDVTYPRARATLTGEYFGGKAERVMVGELDYYFLKFDSSDEFAATDSINKLSTLITASAGTFLTAATFKVSEDSQDSGYTVKSSESGNAVIIQPIGLSVGDDNGLALELAIRYVKDNYSDATIRKAIVLLQPEPLVLDATWETYDAWSYINNVHTVIAKLKSQGFLGELDDEQR